MPTVKQGLRGAPWNQLRQTGERKKPYTRMKAKLFGAKPELLYAMDRTLSVFFGKGLPCIWTSIVRPKNFMRTFSLHPFGWAADCISDRHLPPEMWKELETDLREELGAQYDVLTHDAGSGMHAHLEFDPKDEPEFQKWKEEMKREHQLRR